MQNKIKGVSSQMTSSVIYFYLNGEVYANFDMYENGLTQIPRIGEEIHFCMDGQSSKDYIVGNIEHYINFNTADRIGFQHIYVYLKVENITDKDN